MAQSKLRRLNLSVYLLDHSCFFHRSKTRKTPRDLTEASLSCSGISIIAAVFMIFLFGMELNSYLTITTSMSIIVDKSSIEDSIRIDLNIRGKRSLEGGGEDEQEQPERKRPALASSTPPSAISKARSSKYQTFPVHMAGANKEELIMNRVFTGIDRLKGGLTWMVYQFGFLNYSKQPVYKCCWNDINTWYVSKSEAFDKFLRLLTISFYDMLAGVQLLAGCSYANAWMMADISSSGSMTKAAGKMVIAQPEVVSVGILKPTDINKVIQINAATMEFSTAKESKTTFKDIAETSTPAPEKEMASIKGTLLLAKSTVCKELFKDDKQSSANASEKKPKRD
ncbi:thioredoxin-like fold, Endoplasmic reticulum vesicle transporter [Artemisia annua]|uniref:Thioredoxin-like fold, Endoplasmic reticulum vesicle transporter n=1 Tax=Artemisia annua TaxID=35608 RepID=A0A2U1M9X2_ARTAN|nr:thioredoxin-like fold, Endoplasmic reticulum vesicle transporter [Artemisia annua]